MSRTEHDGPLGYRSGRAEIASHVDVAVVGAGPARAATARQLALAGCRVALLERTWFDAPRAGESLAPNVQPQLEHLGAWTSFLQLQPLCSYGTRSIWGETSVRTHSHLVTPYLQGWHVDRRAFDRMLAECAARGGAQLLLRARVLDCLPSGGGATLRIAHGYDRACVFELRADFVVDATGRSSTAARWFGAERAVFDRLVGVGVEFGDEGAIEHQYTLVETTSDGWWYAAPVAPHRSMAMLMTDADVARETGVRALATWLAALRRAPNASERVRHAQVRWGPRTFSAISHRLVRPVSGASSMRWLAVGDAALAVDPVSGSGVIRALRTARAAAETVLAVLAGDRAAIEDYEADRNKECTTYLIERLSYYGAESRWPSAPFWQRRAEAAERLVAK